MANPRYLRRTIVAATVLFAVVEWLLLELRRAPYRPPYDMRTFLGQERDGCQVLMVIIGGGWLLLAIYCVKLFRFTLRDYLWFSALLALLITIVGIFVAYPWWPVTPPELLWSYIRHGRL